MEHHEFKVSHSEMDDILSGRKNFMIKHNDRDFRSGDTVRITDFDPVQEKTSIRGVTGKIGYITKFEANPWWVVFTFIMD